jgi:DNA mismatch endonuclease (patch repair protein)
MADAFTKQKRSEIMSKIRSSNTKPELLLKASLKGHYFRYHPKVYGNPDFVNKTKKIAVFVDGCFWHKCPTCYRQPQSNTHYWIPKIDRNEARDREIDRKLKRMGWKVCRVWEHEIKFSSKKTAEKISRFIAS